MATPVTKRSAKAGPRLSTQSATAPLATAPSTLLQTMSRRGDHTSGRLVRALARVPTMNPTWTAMVRAAELASPSFHSRASVGRTAEALNQRDNASSSPMDRYTRARQRAAAAGSPDMAEDDATWLLPWQ